MAALALKKITGKQPYESSSLLKNIIERVDTR